MNQKGAAAEADGALRDGARLLGFADVPDAAAGSRIVASLVAPDVYAGWAAEFAALAARSPQPNPFLSPACVAAAQARFPRDEIVILAARDAAAPDAPLTGLWALRATADLWSFGVRVLQTPLEPRFDALSTPMLDGVQAEASLTALIGALKAEPRLPSVVRAASWPIALAPRLPGFAHLAAAECWSRAVLAPEPGIACEDYLAAAMGGAYKKRRAQERALAREGRIGFASDRGGAAVDALEALIALEARGWKGEAGTALAQSAADAAYMRACVLGLADAGSVAIDRITLDGRTVAAGLIVEAGGSSLFWKTAFDETLRRHSPGVLLDMAVTRRLFAEGRPSLDSGMMEFTDPDSQIWSERTALARVCIDVGGGLAGLAARAGKHARHGLRLLQRRLKRA